MTQLEVIKLTRRINYSSVLNLQSRLVARKLQNRLTEPDYLILLQHEPCITLGRRSHSELVAFSASATGSIPVFKSPRGGKMTYHGPGQLTCYPIIDLKRQFSASLSLERYVEGLAEVMKDSLESVFKIKDIIYDHAPERVGLWIPPNNKIGFIGIQVQKWITSHGFSINVTPESLLGFGEIDPCGLRDSKSNLSSDFNFKVDCALENLPAGSEMINYNNDALMLLLQDAVIKLFTRTFSFNESFIIEENQS